MNALRRLTRVLVEGFAGLDTTRQVALGYALYMVAGFAVLALPFSHGHAARPGLLDDLFTAVSAVSTTGLVTVPTSDAYSFLGEFAIMVLIQLGGIGYMTAGSFFMLARSRSLTGVRENVGSVVFSLPEGFSARSLVRGAVVFSLVIEVAGAIALYFAFRDAGSHRPIWDAVFHSVSAFCTAGFGLNPDSMEAYQGHVGLNLIISVLSILGAIGFIVMVDIWRRVSGKITHTTLTTRIILVATFAVIGLGTLLIYLDEPTIRSLPTGDRLMAAFFQAMSASTTVGFNTVPIGALSSATTVVVLMLMVIGASPSGTGGGLKVTTLTAVLATAWATLRGSTKVSFLWREIPLERVRAAASNLALYVLTLVAGVYLLTLTEKKAFVDIAFEASSALGTVGLSRGITADLTPWGKLWVIGLMYIGRVGPVVLGLGMLANMRRIETDLKKEDIAT